MSLNASECCKTIGCNCAGTTMIENLDVLHNSLPCVLLVAGCCLVLAILILIITKEKW
jgi:hypothetical protein